MILRWGWENVYTTPIMPEHLLVVRLDLHTLLIQLGTYSNSLYGNDGA